MNLEKVFSLKKKKMMMSRNLWEAVTPDSLWDLLTLLLACFLMQMCSVSLPCPKAQFPLFGPCAHGTGKAPDGLDGRGEKPNTFFPPWLKAWCQDADHGKWALSLWLPALTLPYAYLRGRCERIKAVPFPYGGDEQRWSHVLHKSWKRPESWALP